MSSASNDRGERWLVIGAGSAGCVVAARLSEDPHRSVTLVDTGPGLSGGEVPDALAGPSFMDALEVPGRTFDTLTATRTPGAIPRT